MNKEKRKLFYWNYWISSQEKIFQFCLKQTNGVTQDAEDLMQQVLLKYIKHFTSSEKAHLPLVPPSKSWFYTAIRNTFIDEIRSKKREASMLEMLNVEHKNDTQLVASNQQIHLLLKKAVNNLEKPYKEIILKRIFEEKPYSEISRELNITECNARKRMQTGLIKLRRKSNHLFKHSNQPASHLISQTQWQS